MDALANLVEELRHGEGWTARARMSKSALMRRNDPVVLVTFENLTERLVDGRALMSSALTLLGGHRVRRFSSEWFDSCIGLA